MSESDFKFSWSEDSWNGEPVLLSGDIGGTNANVALVANRDGDFRILLEAVAPSGDLQGIAPLIGRLLQEARDRDPEIRPELGCISGAGPIANNYCSLSNLPWDIDGNALSREFGFPIRTINDFEAISFGVPLLNLNDPAQVTVVPHSDGSRPDPDGDVRLIVGAGTGLGVGVMIGDGENARALPSEGGHMSFASFDEETESILSHLREEWGMVVEIEDLLSGRGLAALFDYWVKAENPPSDAILDAVRRAGNSEKPGLVSRHAARHELCRQALQTFVKIYGRVAADLAAMTLPRGGLFLAGGIAGKNEPFFLDGHRFVSFFEQNRRPQVRDILKRIPVYIIRNYNISLLGAANAGWVGRMR